MNPLASNRLTEEVIPIIPGAANKYSEEGSQATQTRIAAKLVTIPTPIPFPRTRLRLGIRHQPCLCSAQAPRTHSWCPLRRELDQVIYLQQLAHPLNRHHDIGFAFHPDRFRSIRIFVRVAHVASPNTTATPRASPSHVLDHHPYSRCFMFSSPLLLILLISRAFLRDATTHGNAP